MADTGNTTVNGPVVNPPARSLQETATSGKPQIGNTITNPPPSTGGGGGGGSLLTIVQPAAPADGAEITLQANALNVIDVQNIVSIGLALQLPAASASPAGTPLIFTLVNKGVSPAIIRGPFTIPSGSVGIGFIGLDVTGADTINNVDIGSLLTVFNGPGDTATFYSDGVSNWITTEATWVNGNVIGLALAVGNNLIDTQAFGPVPQRIDFSPSPIGALLVALSAGYFGQIVNLTNAGANPFAIVCLFAGALTGNTRRFFGIAGGGLNYRVDPNETLQVQFNRHPSDGSFVWYVIGHNTALS